MEGVTPQDLDADEASKRDTPRDSMFLQAVLHAQTGGRSDVSVRVRNLSAGGLMAESDTPVVTADKIILEIRNVGKVSGNVVWVRKNRFGVSFDSAIDPKLARLPVGGRKSKSQS